MQQHLSGRADALPGNVPPGLAGIIAKCMRRDPEERYQSVAELIADLDRYQELTAADFQFAEQPSEDLPNADRRILLLAGAMTIGFILLLAVVIGLLVLIQYLRG